MRFHLSIDNVDGSNSDIEISGTAREVYEFLLKRDHEGAVLSLTLDSEESEEVYTILNALMGNRYHV